MQTPSPAFADPFGDNFDDIFHSNRPRSPIGLDDPLPLLPPKRVHKPTERLRLGLEDALPEGPGPLEEEELELHIEPHVEPRPRLMLRIPKFVRTAKNAFGLSRLYRGRPTRVPDMGLPLEQLATENVMLPPPPSGNKRSISDIIWPYPNLSSFKLGKWFWNDGHKKSKGARQSLLDDVILSDDFSPEDLRGVNFNHLDHILAAPKEPAAPWDDNGWTESKVRITIPTGIKTTKATKKQKAAAVQAARRHHEVDEEAEPFETRKFDVPKFHHRSLLHIMRSVIEQDEASKNFHYHPFELFWEPPYPDASTERVHGEMYTSQVFIDADRELQASPHEEGCNLPRAIAGFMFWSDATHVAQFGTAKLWPLYGYFANQSKYDRGMPTARASHQVAYFQGVCIL